MVVDLILGLIAIISILTVFVAFHLIKVIEHRLAWVFIAIGLVAVSVRRILMLLNRFIDSEFLSSPYLTPAAALIMSVMLFLGLFLIVPVIKSFKISESRYRSIFESSGVSLWEEDLSELYILLEQLKYRGISNLKTYIETHPELIEEAVNSIKIIDVNQASLDLFKAKDKETLIISLGDTFTDISRLVFTDYLVSIFNGDKSFKSDTQYLDLEGNILDAILKINNPGNTESLKNSIISISNITSRVQAEKKLLSVLNDKNTLLKELYHRTKNNMQVIIAMLNLRSYSIDNKIISTVFSDMINRIQSMSLVHEKLYKSENLSEIRLDKYIMDLLSLLINEDTIHNSKINFVKDLEPVSVSIDMAIPCGLIINELISNMFKHAFKGIDYCEVDVTLNNLKNDVIELILADNGVGMPEGFDINKSETLGLQTIITLGEEQLHGSVELVSTISGKGSVWRIVFNNSSNIKGIENG